MSSTTILVVSTSEDVKAVEVDVPKQEKTRRPIRNKSILELQ